MLKKRTESKNKNYEDVKPVKTKRTFLIDKNEKNLIKKPSILAYKHNLYDNTLKSAVSTPNTYLLTRSTKSSNVTPKIKSRKSSK